MRKQIYRPNAQATRVYDRLYPEYTRLHDLFGRDASSPMKTLHRLKAEAYAGAAKRQPEPAAHGTGESAPGQPAANANRQTKLLKT